MDILLILSGLKVERLFSFFLFFLSPDSFYLDNLKLVESISRWFKSQTLQRKIFRVKLFYFFYVHSWFERPFQLVIQSQYLTVTYSPNFCPLSGELSSLDLVAPFHANCGLHYINGFVKKTITPSLESCMFLFAQTWCTYFERVISRKAV